MRFVLLASQFHPALGHLLIHGARGVLRRAGVPERRIRVVWVPGSFELPMAAAAIAMRRPRPHAIIALGALIRGQTAQYEVLAQAVIHGLMQVALQYRLPVTCGVIVAQTLAQARARAGGSIGNRGAEAAKAALDLVPLFTRESFG
jgi:6,7-dimethyl-8-ribityllumazine synthase